MERASRRLESVDSADEIKVLLLKREPLRNIVSTAVVISFGIFGGHNSGEQYARVKFLLQTFSSFKTSCYG